MGGVPARALWGALLLTIVGEFAVSAVLERGVPGYDSRFQAMSALGAGDSPVRLWYRVWLVWLGPAFAVGALLVHGEVLRASSSPPLAAASAACLVAFGIGAGVVAGAFPGSGAGRLPAMLHGVGSALGFMALVAVPLLFGLAFRAQEPALSSLSLACFVASAVFFVLFVMADKPAFAGTWVSWGGWWERACLACAYLPVAALSAARILGA
ncbi:DUF998 domain-containing protein [Collinsella tanakaei]|uniref:DUF998 domain-containing protein n=1 Tax=Collinsella tanakaei TaxID=626935 RepID=UPI00195C58A7|nr:DUF998 domain-containing protein [Collinsella tanakaei]MBM6756992.1 DUF998 domain-containing protein [Collinsella tanakaei]